MQKIKAFAQSGAVSAADSALLPLLERCYPTPGLEQLTTDEGKDHPHFPGLFEQTPFSSSHSAIPGEE